MPKFFIYGKQVEFNMEEIIKQFKNLIPFSYDLFTFILHNHLTSGYFTSMDKISLETRNKITEATDILENTSSQNIDYTDLTEKFLIKLAKIEFFLI